MPDTHTSSFCAQFEEATERPVYTGSPWNLFVADIKLLLANLYSLPGIFLPLSPWLSGPLDELCPTPANLADILVHCVLFVAQLVFLISLPFLIFLPVTVCVAYIASILVLNYVLCLHFNKRIPTEGLPSTEDDYSRAWAPHDDEYWIFINGICVG
jgi:hypothetical protein